jgi:hypothetical protein
MIQNQMEGIPLGMVNAIGVIFACHGEKKKEHLFRLDRFVNFYLFFQLALQNVDSGADLIPVDIAAH